MQLILLRRKCSCKRVRKDLPNFVNWAILFSFFCFSFLMVALLLFFVNKSAFLVRVMLFDKVGVSLSIVFVLVGLIDKDI